MIILVTFEILCVMINFYYIVQGLFLSLADNEWDQLEK